MPRNHNHPSPVVLRGVDFKGLEQVCRMSVAQCFSIVFVRDLLGICVEPHFSGNFERCQISPEKKGMIYCNYDV